MDDSIVLFQCNECGYISTSLGWLHAHVETHRGYTFLNIQVPFTPTSPGNVDELMERTTCIRVLETETLPLDAINDPEKTRYGPEADKPVGIWGWLKAWATRWT